MTPEEVAEAYGEAVMDALWAAAKTVPAQSLLTVCLAFQEKFGLLTQNEPTTKPAIHLVTELGKLARAAHETIVEGQREDAERLDQFWKKQRDDLKGS